MVGVVFMPVEINPNLSLALYRSTLVVFIIIVAVVYIRNLVKFFRERKSNQELLELSHEWYENGVAVTNWLKAHHKELCMDIRSTLYHPEFQELIWKDFQIYERLINLDPKLKEDPILNRGREFYGSLIRTENQKPS